MTERIRSKKQILGKFITFGYTDTDETTTGFCFQQSKHSLAVADLEGKVQRFDSLSQVLKVHKLKIK